MKKLVTALVLALGLCVFAALPASAESSAREAEITYRCIKIVLDGMEICPRDVAGNEVEPFILDGTTYLPVRAVADALGLDVRWRDSDSTVLLAGNEDEHGAFSTGIEMPPELPRVAESAQGHNAVESVTLAYRDIRLLAAGMVVEPKDAAGNAVEPFIMDGTTYLPVRAVADALGLAVDWDAASATVRLSHWLVARQNTAFDDGYGTSWVTEDGYEYDALGRPVHNLYSTGTDSSESRWYYDENGRPARRELTTSQDLGERLAGSVTSYTYDGESGLCVSAEIETEERYGVNSWRATVKVEYEYDWAGRLVRAVRSSDGEESIISAWTYFEAANSVCEWSCDETGRVTERREKHRWFDGDKSEQVDRYAYDGEGRLVLVENELRGESDGEPYSYVWQEYFGYDADGREVLYGMRGSSDGDFEQRSTYDGTGRLIRVEWEPSAAEVGEDEDLVEVTEYFYDERGLLARQRTSDGAGYASEYVYTYDMGGRLIRLDFIPMGQTLIVQTWEYVKAGD